MKLKETLKLMEKNNLVVKRAIGCEGCKYLMSLGLFAPPPIELEKEKA